MNWVYLKAAAEEKLTHTSKGILNHIRSVVLDVFQENPAISKEKISWGNLTDQVS